MLEISGSDASDDVHADESRYSGGDDVATAASRSEAAAEAREEKAATEASAESSKGRGILARRAAAARSKRPSERPEDSET